MHHSVLRDALRKQPFVPFQLVLANGSKYTVTGPDWMLITGMTSYVGIPGETADGDIVRSIDNTSICELIPLITGAAVPAG